MLLILLLFLLGFFIGLALQLIITDGYFNNRKYNPILISCIVIIISLVFISSKYIISEIVSSSDQQKRGFVIEKRGFVIEDKKRSFKINTKSSFSLYTYLSSLFWGIFISGLVIISIQVCKYCLVYNKKEIKDINLSIPNEIKRILKK